MALSDGSVATDQKGYPVQPQNKVFEGPDHYSVSPHQNGPQNTRQDNYQRSSSHVNSNELRDSVTAEVSKIRESFGRDYPFKAGTVEDLGGKTEDDVLLLPKIKLLRLVGVCEYSNLTILRLGSNFLTGVEELVSCVNLVWLDLNNNQISKLPSARHFWKYFSNLIIVNVHDNLFEHFRDVQSVAGIKNLIALTVYNTPMSITEMHKAERLKNEPPPTSAAKFPKREPTYRHQLVNSCMNLKALDHHVISDEEIIEHFAIPEGSRFKAKSRNLKINLCPDPGMAVNLSASNMAISSYNHVQRILTDIDQRVKHGSAVQVIQRYARGYLTRTRLKKLLGQTRLKQKIIGVAPINNIEDPPKSENPKLDVLEGAIEAHLAPSSASDEKSNHKPTSIFANKFTSVVHRESLPASLAMQVNQTPDLQNDRIENYTGANVTLNQGPTAMQYPTAANYSTPMQYSAPAQYSTQTPETFVRDIDPVRLPKRTLVNTPNVIFPKSTKEFQGHRPPTTSRVHSARIDSKWQKFEHVWQMLATDKLPEYTLNVLRKPVTERYRSFPVMTDEETTNWIETRCATLSASEREELEAIAEISKLYQIPKHPRQPYDDSEIAINGTHAMCQEFDSHAEKLDMMHLAKVHKSQIDELNSFKRQEKKTYVDGRSKLCKTQRDNQVNHTKTLDYRKQQSAAMLDAIKPLLKMARERAKARESTQLQERRDYVQDTRESEQEAITSKAEFLSYKNQVSRQNEKLEQELIQLALSDNKRRESLHREFAAKRAQIWRMKSQSTKVTMEAGRQFAAELATLNKGIIKAHHESQMEKLHQQKQDFVTTLKEERRMKAQAVAMQPLLGKTATLGD